MVNNMRPLRVDELKMFLRLAKRWQWEVKLNTFSFYMSVADTELMVKDIADQIEERTSRT